MSHIHPVIVVHRPSLFAIQNNEVYQVKYKDNPNSQVIIMNNGAKFIACGQAMNFLDVKRVS